MDDSNFAYYVIIAMFIDHIFEKLKYFNSQYI